jgi:hypothetical protein
VSTPPEAERVRYTDDRPTTALDRWIIARVGPLAR